MFYQNQILIEGRLCQKPELKNTKNGKEFTQFGLCYNKPKKRTEPNEKGYMYDFVPNFFNLTAWNKTAVTASKFNKGDPVTVSGTLSYETWTNERGEKQHKTLILVNSIKKLDVEKRKAEMKESGEIAEAYIQSDEEFQKENYAPDYSAGTFDEFSDIPF